MQALRRVRRSALVLATLAAAGCGGLAVLGRPPGAAAPIPVRVQLSMVNVRGETRDLVLGSGFLLNAEGHVVIAGHMVATARIYLPIKPTAHFTVVLPPWRGGPETVDGRTRDASLVLEAPSLDLAVLQIDAEEITRPGPWPWSAPRVGLSEREIPRLRLDEAPVGATIVLAGYPEGAPPLVEARGRLVDASVLEHYEIYADPENPLLAALRHHAIYLADVATEQGQSGSPVYLAETREVIGVCVSILQLAEGQQPDPPETPPSDAPSITIVVQAGALAALLDAHEIPWRAAP